MAGFNRIVMMGNLTRDPQLSYTPNQTAVVDFGLATNRRWTAADGAQRQETCFVDCRAFGWQAENINKYLTKGRLILVEGRLTFDSWTAQDGTSAVSIELRWRTFNFCPAPLMPGPASRSSLLRGQFPTLRLRSGQAHRSRPAPSTRLRAGLREPSRQALIPSTGVRTKMGPRTIYRSKEF